jgi:hypothetical protein
MLGLSRAAMTRGLHLRSGWIRAALLLLALCALATRFVIPVGFMPESGKIALSICSGKGVAAQIWVDIGKTQHKGDDAGADHVPCTFAASAMPMVSGAPPQLLATAIAYIAAQAYLPERLLPPGAPERLRPPLRGPPSA